MTCGIGLMAGMMSAVMLLIMRDQADRTIKNPGDAQLFVNLPELAVIPSLSADPYLRSLPSESSSMPTRIFKNGSNRQAGLPARAPELAVWRYKSTLLAETIRGLLTSILFSTRDERSLRVLVLTSAGAGEGKSTITSNLAVAMAEVHQRVLLIDADARKPRLHSIFNLPNDAGLTTILTGHKPLTHADLESVIVKSHIPGLSVLPSGPCFDSISTLLHSARLNEILHMLRTSYDSILIDTPPVLQVPDARVLGRRADAVILVARASKTTRDALQAARQRFHDDGVPVLGAILNGWSPKADSSFGYYNPEYYQNRKAATQ
jgi:capsular exopolysaccharide synthesis family protein